MFISSYVLDLIKPTVKMVLFAKTALTRMCLAAQKRNFAYMIKDVNMPQTKVPHPTHVKGNQNVNNFELPKKKLKIYNLIFKKAWQCGEISFS